MRKHNNHSVVFMTGVGVHIDMALFEITKITKSGKTGKRLGIVKANSKRNAIDVLGKFKDIPDTVRVFPVKLIRNNNRKKRVNIFY